MLICLKRIYNFWVIHASFVILPHVFTVIYIIYMIFMHFGGLTYWQDVQCQFPVFVVFLLQKVTSENILGIGQKFMGIFYWRNEDRSQKGDLRDVQSLGATPSRGPPVTRRWDPRGPFWTSAGPALLATVLICWIKNRRKFLSNSGNISRSNFLQQFQHKNRELALGN